MRIDGEWYRCADGVIRRIIRGEVEAIGGRPVECLFLLDTGADFTLLNKATLDALRTDHLPPMDRVEGVSGIASSVVVEAVIWLFHDGPDRVAFSGRYAAVTEARALDMSVLGRDVTHFFALIVDERANVVCLLNQRHGYQITTA
jgi:predicted aspartyl protease